MPARRIDLHTHSAASDGSDTPARLAAEAAASGLDVFALTDHDTTDGWAAAAAALPAGLTLVPGAELSCRNGGVSLHLLAYLFDPADPPLARAMGQLRKERVGRAERMVALLEADGHPVSWAQVRALAAGTVGRPHVAQALVASGLVRSIDEAFGPRWIGAGGRYWTGRYELEAVEAVRLVAAAGGVTVLAHALATSRGRTVGEAAIEELAAAGLAGLEVEHPDHEDSARVRLRETAARLDLLVTGASDYHGTVKAVRLASHLTDPAVYDELVRRGTGCQVIAA